MKNNVLKSVYGLTAVLLIFSGCANYNATALSRLSPDVLQNSSTKSKGITIAAKAFDKNDCDKYLDRDVIAKGYQPVQLYIQNDSDESYIFSLSRITLPVARYDEVAEKVHTSTVGRAVGYGAAAVLTCGLFAIPAVVDGVKSANANDALDSDFSAKTAKDQIIAPHSHLNTLIFVPVSGYQSTFDVTLVDKNSNQIEVLNVSAR